jgi:hypothetical protein
LSMSSHAPQASVSDLAAFCESDDVDGILAAFPRLDDDMRSLAWDALRRRLVMALHRAPGDEQLTSRAWAQRARASALLALSIGPPDVARQVGTRIVHEPESDAIIASRSPAWRSAFAVATVRSWASEPEVGLFGPRWWDWWRWLRRQEQMDLLPIDEGSPDYLVVMIRGLMFSGSIEEAVRQDRGLAEGPLWALFEPAPPVQKALLGSERYWNPANTWRVALVRLALEGLIDRDRLERAATAAAGDERMGRGHRGWYRKIPGLLDKPNLLPTAPEHGAPPPGNQLFPRV